ncbi:MAG: hypothetical protein GXX94_09545 [Chloroflexi bacterium]|nr:hypothetical protein [Chloroflexota bacterium]
MKHEGIQAIIGAAIVDSVFRRQLLEDARSAITEFCLPPDDAVALLSAKATTFQGLATEMQIWIASSDGKKVLCP